MEYSIDTELTRKLNEWYKKGNVSYNPETERYIVDFGEGNDPVTVTTREAAEVLVKKPDII